MHVTLKQTETSNAPTGVLAVEGEVDADNCGEFGAALLDQAPDGEQVVVDLSGLTFIDSSGISELLRVSNALSEQGRTMTIRDPSAPVKRVLEITGLLEHFGLS